MAMSIISRLILKIEPVDLCLLYPSHFGFAPIVTDLETAGRRPRRKTYLKQQVYLHELVEATGGENLEANKARLVVTWPRNAPTVFDVGGKTKFAMLLAKGRWMCIGSSMPRFC